MFPAELARRPPDPASLPGNLAFCLGDAVTGTLKAEIEAPGSKRRRAQIRRAGILSAVERHEVTAPAHRSAPVADASWIRFSYRA